MYIIIEHRLHAFLENIEFLICNELANQVFNNLTTVCKENKLNCKIIQIFKGNCENQMHLSSNRGSLEIMSEVTFNKSCNPLCEIDIRGGGHAPVFIKEGLR